jgi:glycosyltransferase involved in cell wall biosynthesis
VKKSPYGFSLILPCYNDKESIEGTVKKSDKALKSLFSRYEIILINDASTDNSNEILERIQKKYSSVKIINNSINLGQGSSVLIGLNIARYDLVIHNGIDSPFNLHNLSKILYLFPKSDIVVITRIHSSGYSRWRKFISLTNRMLRFLLFHVPYADLNFVQIYKKSVLKNLNIKSRSPGFVTQELVMRARKQGYKVTQIQLPYYPRKKNLSHHGKLRDIIWSFSDMMVYWLEQFYEK